jgi:hypothetical protein
MIQEVAAYTMVLIFLLFLLFWPGFLLQRILVGSEAKSMLEVVVYSTAFGLAFLVIVCPLLNLVWNISLFSVSCSVILLSVLFFFSEPHKYTTPGRWELLILGLILGYGFLLRSYTLFDFLPEGQDAWVHISFIQYIHEHHALPLYLPWAEPLQPVDLVTYPPGAHCIGALLSQPLPTVSYPLTKVFFISLGTGSALSSYIVIKPLFSKKVGLLSTFFVAIFVPHMIMTTEVTAEAGSIFIYPLVLYLFYRGKMTASGILLGSIALIHHLTTFAVIIPLTAYVIIKLIQHKDTKYFLSSFKAAAVALAVSAPWWSQQSLPPGMFTVAPASAAASRSFFEPYIQMVSPLFILFSMIGVFILLKSKKPHYIFLITWCVTLFLASQPGIPMMFHPHRFLAFFVFPCSVVASLGLLALQNHIKKVFFVLLLLLVFSTGSPPHFWPSVGEDNAAASEWVEDSTLDSVFYVHGHHYIFVYCLSDRKINRIIDFDNPFSYTPPPTYFYDDADWTPHDISRFGMFDRVYSCSGVVIYRIA